jgi:hypothetical protein
MSDVNTGMQSQTPTNNFDFSSISDVLNVVSSSFSISDTPITPLPPPLILIGGVLRTGLSADEIASNIISRQSEAGLIVGDAFADGKNSLEQMELIRIQEIIKALMLNAKIEVVIPPGVSVTSVGIGNLGAPVLSLGYTTTIGSGYGVIR